MHMGGGKKGRRTGHSSEPGSPYCHSTIPSPKSPMMGPQSAWDTEPGPLPSWPSGAVRLVSLLRSGSLQLFFAHLAGAPPHSQLRLTGLLSPILVNSERQGEPRGYSVLHSSPGQSHTGPRSCKP